MKIGTVNVVHIVITICLTLIASIGWMTLRNQTQPAPIVIEPAPTAMPPQPTATPAPISVFVNGAVVTPGVYELAAGARVQDLVEKAGGFSAEAFVDGVNLAQVLRDGMQVYVATWENSAEIEQALQANPIQGGAADVGGDSAESRQSGITADGLININTANRDELEEVPGVGPSTAQAIISYREDNGPFTDIEEIMNVSGIGEGKFEQMKDAITAGP